MYHCFVALDKTEPGFELKHSVPIAAVVSNQHGCFCKGSSRIVSVVYA